MRACGWLTCLPACKHCINELILSTMADAAGTTYDVGSICIVDVLRM